MPKPQRIMIFGGPGSGKSTLARQIGALSGLPVVHIDPMYWAPNWVQRGRDETVALSLAAAKGEAWVFEGNHAETMDARMERADVIIFLDLPRSLRMLRVLRRIWAYRGQTRPDMPANCPERLDFAFLRDFVWNYGTRARPRAMEMLARWQGKRRIYHLRSGGDLRRLIGDADFLAQLRG